MHLGHEHDVHPESCDPSRVLSCLEAVSQVFDWIHFMT